MFVGNQDCFCFVLGALHSLSFTAFLSTPLDGIADCAMGGSRSSGGLDVGMYVVRRAQL